MRQLTTRRTPATAPEPSLHGEAVVESLIIVGAA